MASVLVTGGAGFIGSNLSQALIRQNHKVRVLDNLSSSSEASISGIGAELVVGDVRDSAVIDELVKGVDWIFHEAAQVSVPGSIDDPIECYEINLAGTLALLEAAKSAGIKKVIFASSAAVYGQAVDPVIETSPKYPQSPYAASKLAMEEAALMYSDVYGLQIVCLRYFNVYGPRQRPDSAYAAVIPAFITAMIEGRPPIIFGDGDQRRDFVHVDDVVRANILAAENDDASGQILNLSGGRAVTINELAAILHELLPNAPEPIYEAPRDGDIYTSEAVIEHAWRTLEYRPEVALVEGLRSTVEWFRQQRLQTPR